MIPRIIMMNPIRSNGQLQKIPNPNVITAKRTPITMRNIPIKNIDKFISFQVIIKIIAYLSIPLSIFYQTKIRME